jgi:hypothetical protein
MDEEPLGSLFVMLRRYAGWLDRGRPSAAVRSSVDALGTAVDAGGDTSRLIQTLEDDIARLPSGGVRKMLVTTARGVRRLLAEHSPTGFVTAEDAKGAWFDKLTMSARPEPVGGRRPRHPSGG